MCLGLLSLEDKNSNRRYQEMSSIRLKPVVEGGSVNEPEGCVACQGQCMPTLSRWGPF